MYIEEQIEELQRRIEKLEARQPVPEEWLTVPEAARRLNVGTQTLYRKIRSGEIYASQLTGSIRIPISQFYDEKTEKIVELPRTRKRTKKEPEWAEEVRRAVWG